MREKQHPITYFLMVATGIFLSTMDSSMVNVALPFIMRSFSTTLASVEWVVLIYLLTITVSLLIWGQISDRFGKGVIYLLGMLIFTLGCLCCFFSKNLELLVASRFIQGLGAAMMMSTGPAIIRLVYPQEHIGKWLGLLGVFTSMGLMSGPLLGGFLVHNFHWRAIFIITAPVSLLVFFFGWRILAGTLPRYVHEKRRFDWTGSLFWTFLIVVFVLLFTNHNQYVSVTKIVSILFILLLFILFFRFESNSEDPLFPIGLLRQKYYGIAMATSALSFAILFIILILMPFYLHYVQKLNPDKIGLLMMSVPVSLFIVSPMSGKMFDKIGAKYLTSCGLVVTGISIILLSFIHESSAPFDIAWRLALLGCGQSLFLSPNTASVLSQVSRRNIGATSGMLATCRNLGMLSGVALAGMIFGSLFHHYSGGSELKYYTDLHTTAFLSSFRITLYFAAIVAFIGALVSAKRDG